MVRFRRLGLLILALTSLFSAAQGQQHKYIVYLNGKPDPQYSLSQPAAYLGPKALSRRAKNGIEIKFRDLPVSPSLISQVRNLGVTVHYASKWLNALLIETDSLHAIQVANLPFVVGSPQRLTKSFNKEEEDRYSNLCVAPMAASAMAPTAVQEETDTQNAILGMDVMHQEGNFGQGVLVAVLDAGFPDVNTASTYRALRDSSRIVYTYDFVDHNSLVYDDHWHGAAVLSVMAGTEPGNFTGGAPKANYILLRTENAIPEAVDECFYWVMGAERADSLGADVINSSLGYTRFDNPNLDFSLNQLDGHSLFISRGAEQAADCGIVVVISAGNEGGNPNWGGGKVGAPADADSILTIGAVFSDSILAPFSSVGPTADGRIKPDVVGQGVNDALYDARMGSLGFANGTSFSSPLVASLVTGLVSKFPNATAMDIRQAVINSGDRHSRPDTLFGNGLPNYGRAKSVLTGLKPLRSKALTMYPNPVKAGKIIVLPQSLSEVRAYDNVGKAIALRRNTEGKWLAPIAPGLYRFIWTVPAGMASGTLVVEP